MSIIRLDNKGQISAEYLLLFVVILTVFLFMISHFIGPTIDASNNVSAVSDTKVVVQSIADAVNVVYSNGPGAKRTLTVNVPHDMVLTFDSDNHVIGATVNNLNYTLLNKSLANSKVVTATINCNNDINPSTDTPNQLTLDKSWYTIQVYWNPESNEFLVNATKS